jgi:Sulfotransferase family
MSVRVLFVGGLGRSGSTVLDLLLGDVPGVAAIGEVRHLWERGLRDNALCACGEPFHDCPFWQRVGEVAFGGWGTLDPTDAIATARAVDRHRQLPATAGHLGGRRGDLERYGDLLCRLFAAVAEVAGARLVVDSSKDPPHGFVLRRTSGIDLRAAHMVRDPRGVAYSWAKSVPRPDARDGAHMTRTSVARTALMWVDANILVELLARLHVPTVRVRYEDLVADPEGQVRRVLHRAGLEPAAVRDGGARAPQHAIAGNPVRFADRPVALVLDDEWRRAMPARDRRLATALTSPMLWRYGYSARVA